MDRKRESSVEKVDEKIKFDETKEIQLESSEGKLFTVNANKIRHSQVILEMLSNLGVEDDEELVIPFKNIDTRTLGLIVEWIEEHGDEEIITEDFDKRMSTIKFHHLPEWDKNFLDLDLESLKGIIVGANFLDIKKLLWMACIKVSSMIKGKEPDAIVETFNVQRRSEEERKQANKEISEERQSSDDESDSLNLSESEGTAEVVETLLDKEILKIASCDLPSPSDFSSLTSSDSSSTTSSSASYPLIFSNPSSPISSRASSCDSYDPI